MVRTAKICEINRILEIYETARSFMHTHGNPTQWAGKYPDIETLEDDIKKEQLYVITSDTDDNKIYGCFAMIGGTDPTYVKIYDGAWKDDSPYAAIHRVASDGTERGIFFKCFDFARRHYNHLRIDTHKDNIPMQGAIKKCGFEYCGVIHLENGDPRIAFEWVKK